MAVSAGCRLTVLQVQSCFDCQHQSDLPTATGYVSHCFLLDEDIHDESIAQECEGWEK